jgi:hypothetical protein
MVRKNDFGSTGEAGDAGFEDRVRAALRAEAETVQPAGDGLRAVQARTGRRTAARGRTRWAVGGAVLATAAAVTAVAVVGGQVDLGGGGDGGEVAPAGPVVESASVAVYYLDSTPERRGEPGSETVDDPGLYRELHDVPLDGGRVEAAVRELMSSPPADPDYVNPWRGTSLEQVQEQDGVVRVGVDAAPAGETRAAAEQQLAHTVRAAAAGDVAVDLVVQDSPPQRIQPGPAVGTYAGIWVLSPQQNATVTSPVTFSGMAATFEGNVAYEVSRGGAVVAEGATISSGGMGVWSEWSFTERLEPGEYTLTAYDVDAALGGRRDVDTKDFTVR